MSETFQHDFEDNKGGFWVLPDGSSVPVKDCQQHENVLSRISNNEMSYYSHAFKRGWVKIGTYHYELIVRWDEPSGDAFERPTPAALRAAAEITREAWKRRQHDYEQIYVSIDGTPGHHGTFSDRTPEQVAVSRLRALALETELIADGEAEAPAGGPVVFDLETAAA